MTDYLFYGYDNSDDDDERTQPSASVSSAASASERTQPHVAAYDDDATQPHIAPIQTATPEPNYRKSDARHRGRLRGCLVTFFAIFFACSAISSIYNIIMPPLDVLVLGLDSRGSEGNVARTDSIMILGAGRFNISLLSIPRDLFIEVPNYGTRRINTVNVLGEMNERGTGALLLSDAIAVSFGIQPDRYVRLNFDAFRALVDSIGGITVEVEREIVDYNYPTDDFGTRVLRIPAGRQHMDGETALAYARTRHADDDYQRAARQQQVLRAVTRKVLNPVYAVPAAITLSQYVETNINPLDAARILPPLVFNAGQIDQLVIDRDYIVGGVQGAVPNYEKLRPWIEPRFD